MQPSGNIVETHTQSSMAAQVEIQNFTRFYANHAQLNIALYEIRLVMNFVTGINPENNHLIAPESLILSMAPELAHAVHAMLGKALENYKRDFGELRGPKAIKVKDPFPSLPFDPAQVVSYEVLPDGIVLNLKDGSHRTIQGDELTDEVKRFVATSTSPTPL